MPKLVAIFDFVRLTDNCRSKCCKSFHISWPNSGDLRVVDFQGIKDRQRWEDEQVLEESFWVGKSRQNTKVQGQLGLKLGGQPFQTDFLPLAWFGVFSQ